MQEWDYDFRAQFIGSLRWQCGCGNVQVAHVDLKSYQIQCKACQAWFTLGIRFLVNPRGYKRKIPRDRIFPVLVTEDYKPGDYSITVGEDSE